MRISAHFLPYISGQPGNAIVYASKAFQKSKNSRAV